MKDKLKSYSFWMSVSAAVVLVVNNIGKHFGFYVDNDIIAEIVDSICGVLILFGVLTMTKEEKKSNEENIDNKTNCNSKSQDEKTKNSQIQKKEDKKISINEFDKLQK